MGSVGHFACHHNRVLSFGQLQQQNKSIVHSHHFLRTGRANFCFFNCERVIPIGIKSLAAIVARGVARDKNSLLRRLPGDGVVRYGDG